ncbi:MAG TPA: glycine--tRNA ligase subunit beta [Burkholderiales bacterium]|nr:glycine--tRNA ligase subunit beta [Burkholderiales bacterium]
MQDSLLIELLTEELPPRTLLDLAKAFAHGIFAGLREQDFLAPESTFRDFATPRRLAVLITHVRDQSPDREVSIRGPSVSSALDANGKPTLALLGFARSRGVSVDKLQKESTSKGEFFIHRDLAAGAILQVAIYSAIEDTLAALPLSKTMGWGDGEEEFARPVHGLVILHGGQVISSAFFGCPSANITLGHRFMGKGKITISHPDNYETLLESQGKVIPDFGKRRSRIAEQFQAAAGNATLALDEALLDEVTALTEYPIVYHGRFDETFLTVPQECLMLAMKQHQRYVPLLREGELLPRFLMVANIETAEPGNIITGNERVLHARLADAKFFFDQDRKVRLDERVPQLAKIVYHNKLGSQLARVERITVLTGIVAAKIGADRTLAERAAFLCKADLTSDMVGEFPELQGIMGGHYARHDGEPEEVTRAIAEHYRPRFSGDTLPQGAVAISVAVADKLEALAGFFGIGQQPTGDKDPFALRRHALGIVRILVERELPLSPGELVDAAFSVFPSGILRDAHTDLELFIVERLRSYLRDAGYSANEVESVLSLPPTRIDLILKQLAAVRAFADLPEAQSLAAANKRVVNILKQAETRKETYNSAQVAMLKEPAERALFDALKKTSKQTASLFEQGDFTGYLKSFAVLKSPVDAFFDSVMVMVEDESLRRNRLALLADLRREMTRIADISKLAA